MICRKLEKCVSDKLSGVQNTQCDNNKTKCIESSDKRSEVKCEENRKKYVLVNTKKRHVISYKVDGGIVVEDQGVPQGTSKCDYMLIDNDDELTAILVELKGVDVPKALKQISGTLVLFKEFFKEFSQVYARVIVASSTPNLKATPGYVNLAKTLHKKYNGNLKIARQQLREPDSDLNKA